MIKPGGVDMLYTVIPLEQIYRKDSKNRKIENKTEKKTDQSDYEYKEVLLPHGRIITRREGDDHIIERINSTNMSDYLNTDYHPGKKYNHS